MLRQLSLLLSLCTSACLWAATDMPQDTIPQERIDTTSIITDSTPNARSMRTSSGQSRCVATTQAGTQCSRAAVTGSVFCRQHLPKKDSNYKDPGESAKRKKAATKSTSPKKTTSPRKSYKKR